MDIIIYILLALGLFFCAVGVIGIFRMPDVFGRLQASTCIASLGTICLMLAGMVYAISHGMGMGTCIKLVLVMLLVLCTNPVASHALLKGAYLGGIKSAKELVVDDFKEDDPE